MTITITGATGRLGRLVATLLLKKGHALRLIVRDIGKAQKLLGLPSKNLSYFEADLENSSPQNLQTLFHACKNADCVVHLAAKVDYSVSEKEIFKANVYATKNLLATAKKALAKRFVFCSSTAVYRKAVYSPIDEHHPFTPKGPYGKSKVQAEKEVRESGLKYVILRPSLIYGPGFETGFKAISKLIEKNKMIIIGNGENRISLLHANDAARAFALAATSKDKLVENDDFIITGQAITQKKCYALVAKALGKPAPTMHVPKTLVLAGAFGVEIASALLGKKPILRKEYVDTLADDRVFSILKAKKLLKWQPEEKFEDAVPMVKTWFN